MPKTAARNIVVAGDYVGNSVVFKSKKVSIYISFRESKEISKETVLSYEVITEENRNLLSSFGSFSKAALLLGYGFEGVAMMNMAGEEYKLILVSVQFKDGKKSLLEVDGAFYKAIVTLCYGIQNNSEISSNIPKASGAAQVPAQPQINAPEEIRKYKALLDDGIITQDEFDIKKKQLLELQPSQQSVSEVTNVSELDTLSATDVQLQSIDDKINQRLELVNTIFHSDSENAKTTELETHHANDERSLPSVDDIKHKVIEIVNTEAKVSSLSIFESIPIKKLTKAISSYAKLSSAEESVVLFYDATFLLNNYGFVLTTKNIYFRDLNGKGDVNIADIINITFDPKAKPEASLFIDTASSRYQIGIWNLPGNNGDDTLSILNKVIAVLTNRY